MNIANLNIKYTKLKRKGVSKSIVVNIISYGISSLTSFFLASYLVNSIGTETYGFYGIANNIVNYITIISTALNSMASRFITIELVKGNGKQANKYFSSVFFANIILSAILVIPLVFIIIFIDNIFNISIDLVPTIQVLFSLVFSAFIIRLISSVFGVATFAKDRVELRGYVEIIKNIVRVILYLMLFGFISKSVVWVGVVVVIVEVINIYFYYTFTKKLLPEMEIKKEHFYMPAVKTILKSGIWNSINQLGSSLMYNIDLIIANIFLGGIVSGELAIVHVIPNLLCGIISTLVAVFLPKFTINYAENNIDGLIKEVIKSQKIMAIIANIPICVFIGLSYEFFKVWVPNNNTMLLSELSIITVSYLLIVSVTWPISNLNIVLNKIKLPSLLMVFNGVLNILFSMLLFKFTDLGVYIIPITTTIISAIWYGIFIPIYPCKILNISLKTFYYTIFKVLVTSILSILAIVYIKQYFKIYNWFSLISVGILCGVITLIINITLLTPIVRKILSCKIKRK